TRDSPHTFTATVFLVAHPVAGIPSRVLHQVILMILLRPPPGARRDDFGDDRPMPLAAGIHLGLDLFRNPLLLVVMVEDGAPVAGARIVPLAVQGGRIVHPEEEAEQGF